MDAQRKLSIQMELLFWLITLIVVFGFIYPFHRFTPDFMFTPMIIVFIAAFITFTRYIFLLKFTFLAYRKWWKAGMIILMIPLVFHLISQLNTFQTYVDEEGLDQFFRGLPLVQRIDLTKYIRAITVFFGTGSIIASIMLALRLIISIWRNINKNAV